MDEKEVWERLTSVESSVKSAHHRIDSIEKLTQSVSDMVVEVRHMREDVNKVQNEMELVKNRPLKIYDKFLWAIAGAAISGVVSIVLTSITA
ncbi:MAG: hypothetical protein J6Q94_09260 [Clostridia bacterium]|nr:hypothetical protein [Clostridia bacterium]